MYIRNEKGITLPLVLFVFTLLMVFGISTLFITSSQAKFNYRDHNAKQALDYAEAGYNVYLWHLNDDVNFYSTRDHQDMMNKPIPFQDGNNQGYYMLNVSRPTDADRFVTIKSTGWNKDEPDQKRTIIAKVRKKQFVHHVYVSENDGDDIWWTTGDESHGPYHTNKNLRIQKSPIFYDTLTYSKDIVNRADSKGKNVFLGGLPEKVDELKFPKSNQSLKQWAEKDNMVFTGRTCIYLDGDYIKIREGNAKEEDIRRIPMSNIKNKVIYVENDVGWQDTKFDLKTGNVFVSGELKGRLTIAAANNIYITATDPTNWYDEEDKNHKNPPTNYPNELGKRYGITYRGTEFWGNKSNGSMSVWDRDKKIWTRYAEGKDMLGLVANNDIMILHYGWPRYMDGGESTYNKPYWNYIWKSKTRTFGRVSWDKVNYEYDVAPKNIFIHSHLFAINGGFGFESFKTGSAKQDIVLWGNITQNTRKGVGTFNQNTGNTTTGYKKKYAHDPRMFYDYPPHILEPTNVGWEVHDWKETNEHIEEKIEGVD